ncbi:protein SFI1 homolog [Macrotis lagotis]|uniref:protein SFI1 homolog n=1 Tax=Macrotis lagotis TaxID=92651 RepID=UPI003D6927C5
MEGDWNFSQSGAKVTLGSKAQARFLKKDAAVTQPLPKVPRSKVPSIPWQRAPSKGRPLPNQSAYTWNRRGRLRELRIRCLARKFFFLWARQSFGRVLPSRARYHYERRLLQTTFEEWKDTWWVVRREWKLRVRADCHYRYTLYNLMFQAWQTYVGQQRDKKNKYRRAEHHVVKQRLRLVWKHWLIYVDVCRTKSEMHAVAQEFRQQSILRVPWRVWRRQVQKSHMGRVMDTLALRHWASSLQGWAWCQWREQFLYVQVIRKKEVEAARHHARHERHRALEAWRCYLQGRREKQQQAEVAGRFHCTTVLRTGFLAWCGAWERRKRLHAHQARIEALAARITLRRAFERWKHYMLVSAECAASWAKAKEHWRRHLLLNCFRALKDNVTDSHLHRLRKNLAHGQYQAMLLQRFWHQWCAQAEQREDEKQLSQILRAHSHYRAVLLHKCLQLWLQNAQESRHSQMQSSKADHHYRSRNLSILFQAWKNLSDQRQEQRARQAEASDFHRELVKRWAFNVWRQKTSLQRETRLSERMAILHAERQGLWWVWSTWHRRAAELSMARRGQATACAHYCRWLLRKTFQTWKKNLGAVHAQQAGALRATAFRSGKLLHLTWSKWREYVALQNMKWEKRARAHRHYHQMLLRRTLAAWMSYQGWVRVVLRQVAEREERCQRELLRWVFHVWRENTAAQVEEARKIYQAEEHYRRTILCKVAIHWRDTVALMIYYRQQNDMAITAARKQLERGHLRALFRQWRECGQRASLQRAQLWQAAQHHCRRLLQVCLARWKEHHLQCIRKTLLQRRGAQLMAQRLSRSSFSTWKHQLGERQWEQQATVRALWLWSFTLQGKVWAAWLGFVLERRRKKARLEQAALVYHGGLVHEGVTRLLRFLAGMKRFRGHLHAQQHAQVAHNLHQVVHRCATLWKYKALAKDRSCSLGATSKKRVTFEVPVTDVPPAAIREATVDAEPSRPRRDWSWPLHLASGDPYLPDLNVTRPVRKQPRCPNFLLDSLQRDGSTRLLAEIVTPPSSVQPSPSVAPGAPGPGLRIHTGSGGLPKAPSHGACHTGALLPPTFSTASDRDLLESPAVGMAPSESGPQCVAAGAMTGRLQPGDHLLLPKDLFGSRGEPSLGLKAAGGSQTNARRELGILADGSGLEAEIQEIQEIQEKLFSYQANKQSLRSWQRQAGSLRKWLELSMEDPRPEEEEVGRQVQQELHQVEKQISRLAEELQAQRQQVQQCMARLRTLRAAFVSP